MLGGIWYLLKEFLFDLKLLQQYIWGKQSVLETSISPASISLCVCIMHYDHFPLFEEITEGEGIQMLMFTLFFVF